MTENYVYDVYIADCSKNGEVYCYSLTDVGTLKEKSFLSVSNPMFLNVDCNKMHVVLRSRSEFDGDSATVTFDIDENGQLVNMSDFASTVSVFEYSDGILTLCDTIDSIPNFEGKRCRITKG